MINAQILSAIIFKDVSLWLVEPNIYSVYSPGEMPGAYDSFGVSTIYDLVACNRLYNWVTLCENALASSSEGWVLDIACGSLAFTAKFYANYSERPVVLLDQSLKLLRKGKSRLMKRNGKVPANMVFLHADALQLPFKGEIFRTIISLNLLHCLDDVKTVLKELKRVLTADGTAALTTLVRNKRWSDSYLNMLARSGVVVPRSPGHLLSAFDDLDMPVKHQIKGNLAFINYG
ncbi:MAG: class I SAM-dependent methyltransferase [Deltaproteobacteria bacterium]|nr:class I SAM-dependent methyltransferase [Deltaproteobacteria bacterium]